MKMLSHITLLFLLVGTHLTLPHPVPEESTTATTTTTTTTTTSPSSSSSSTSQSHLALRVLPDDTEDHSPSPSDDVDVTITKRHTTSTPSPAELEERRVALIKALGGGNDDLDDGSNSQLVTSLQGLGSLATDVVTLLTSNANETFAPLREARQRAKQNFPDFGTQLNRYLRNGREYAVRAYRGLSKNLRVKMTNLLRFMLQAITRIASTVGGLYNVLISLLDVATRGVQTGARVGSKLLVSGSNLTVRALATSTTALKNLAQSGVLIRPFNQAIKVGRGLAMGLSEDLFDKVEWAQEGLNSKLELGAALAPNFLLRAHERTTTTTASPSGGYEEGGDSPSSPDLFPFPPSSEDDRYSPPSQSIIGGYAKVTQDDADMALSALASSASEFMLRGGREVQSDKGNSSTNSNSTGNPTSLLDLPPQGLLNDIFGLEQEIDEIKQKSSNSSGNDDNKTS